jgi:hypothetical protein
MKSVYFAARYSRRDELNGYRAELEALGLDVTSRWLATEPRERFAYSEDDWRELGAVDQEDVLAADALVCFTEGQGDGGSGGRHVELGMALALGRRVIVVGRREHIFHHLPEVEFVESWPEALRLWLRAWTPPSHLRPSLDSQADAWATSASRAALSRP